MGSINPRERKQSSYTLDAVSDAQLANSRGLEAALRSLRDAQDVSNRRLSLPTSLSSHSRDFMATSSNGSGGGGVGAGRDKLPKTRSGSNWKLKANAIYPTNLQASNDANDHSSSTVRRAAYRAPLGGKYSASHSPTNRKAPVFDFADSGTASHTRQQLYIGVGSSCTKIEEGITAAAHEAQQVNGDDNADTSNLSICCNTSQLHDDVSQLDGPDAAVDHSWKTLNDPTLVHSPPPLHSQQHRPRFDYGALQVNNDDSSVVSYLTAQSGPSPTSSAQFTNEFNKAAADNGDGGSLPWSASAKSKKGMGLPSPVYREMRMVRTFHHDSFHNSHVWSILYNQQFVIALRSNNCCYLNDYA